MPPERLCATQPCTPARSLRSAPLHLAVTLDWPAGLRLTIQDDGVGLGSHPASPGSGQGLALHSTLMAVIGGSLALESTPGEYTRVVLSLPE